MYSSVVRWGHVQRHVSLLSSRPFSMTSTCFAGHNKWSKIKHRKGIEDAKKSKIYGKAARDILSAAKAGHSANPDENSLLAVAIRRAKEAGVPKESIENALEKAERTKGRGQAMLFEAMFNGAVGIIIECRSDNVNRTVKHVKDLLSVHSARTAPVKFLFQQRGYVKVRIADDMDALLDRVMHICAIDFAEWDEDAGQRGVELVCPPEDLGKVMKVISDHASTSPLCEVLTSEVNWAPLQPQQAGENAEEVDRLESLIDALEENDDVERTRESYAAPLNHTQNLNIEGGTHWFPISEDWGSACGVHQHVGHNNFVVHQVTIDLATMWRALEPRL